MKVLIPMKEVVAAENMTQLLSDHGIDTNRPFNVQGAHTGVYLTVCQEDLKKEDYRPLAYGYCYSCKEVVELGGEQCFVCGSYIKFD